MTSAIIVAAGTSQRMGFDKLFAPLDGRPVLLHSIETFQKCEEISEIVLVVHPERTETVKGLIEAASVKKVARIVAGGSQRHLSVWEGLRSLGPGCGFVAVHDAARPLVRPSAISAAVRDAERFGAVSLAAPVVDTLKKADPNQQVAGSVDRNGLWAMQTPQIFRCDWLIAAYRRVLENGETVTDEVSAVQAAGFPIRLVANADWNLKITYQRDLDLAEILIKLQK